MNFDSIQPGSLIGTDAAESFEIILPVPETNAEFDRRVNTHRIGNRHVQALDDFFADDTSKNAGFFSFTDTEGGTSTRSRTGCSS